MLVRRIYRFGHLLGVLVKEMGMGLWFHGRIGRGILVFEVVGTGLGFGLDFGIRAGTYTGDGRL